MKRFRLSTLLLLVVVAALLIALVVQQQRTSRREAELRARLALSWPMYQQEQDLKKKIAELEAFQLGIHQGKR